MSDLIVVLDNVRSAHNVGSILRTCDGFGVTKVFACGVTPYPIQDNDARLSHVAKRAHKQIAKTALGAEDTVSVTHYETTKTAIEFLRSLGIEIWAIDQDPKSEDLSTVSTPIKTTAIVLGNEINGVDFDLEFEKIIELPMKGDKESFNVSVTAGIVIYQLTK
jgi:tRNA G18 (ribose-2'-O)-methylase SpoU